MTKVTDINKYRPNPNEYIPGDEVAMAMQWYGESNPQRAWDKLIHQVLKEIISGDEEIEKVRSGREIVEWADQFRKHFTQSDLADSNEEAIDLLDELFFLAKGPSGLADHCSRI